MKHFGKKLLSLGLVAIMLASMIPMGIFSAFAADLDYNQSEFVISNKSDLEKISTYGGDFAEKTITLAADIDASGLNPLFSGFAGTFDGDNHKIYNVNGSMDAFFASYTEAGAVIKNLTVEGELSGASADSVAMLIGTHEGGSLTVSNVTVNASVSATGKYVGGIVGLLKLGDGETATFENINANVTVTNDMAVPTNEMSGTGAVIGMYEPVGKPTLNIKNVNLSGSLSAKASVGGVIGAIFTTKTVGSIDPYNNDRSGENAWYTYECTECKELYSNHTKASFDKLCYEIPSDDGKSKIKYGPCDHTIDKYVQVFTYECNTCDAVYDKISASDFEAMCSTKMEDEKKVLYGPCACHVKVANGYTTTSYGGVTYAGNDNSYIDDIHATELYTGGEITIANCESTMTISTDVATELIGAGGVVGTFGGFIRYFGDTFAFDGELNINNCAIGGEIKNTSGASHPISVGGILGAMSYSHATVNVDHCLITATFPPENSMMMEEGVGAGLIMGGSGCQTMSALNVNNTVTTAEEFALVGSIVSKASSSNNITGAAWLVLNDKNLASNPIMYYDFLDEDPAYYMYSNYAWTYSAAVTDSSVVTVTPEEAAKMIETANGYIKRIGGQVMTLGVQDNVANLADSSNKYAIRFIGASLVDDMQSAKMTVVVRRASTGKAFKRYTSECKLYDALNAYDVDGARIGYYKATDFGAKKFLALTIGDIPVGEAYTFDITPSYTNTSGVEMTGETVSIQYTAVAQYDKDKASFDVAPLVTAPTVRVMSSNIMIESKAAPGEALGQINKVSGTGWDLGRRLEEMANMLLAYQPDFIGLQEVTIGTYPVIGGQSMQSKLKELMGSSYEYVDFSNQLNGGGHTTPLMYRSDKWEVLKVGDVSTDSKIACDMHRWQWALFENLDNGCKMIVMNLHGHTSSCGKYDVFFADVNRELKEIEAKYPGVAIAITGDYNLGHTDYRLTQTMIDGTQVENAFMLSANAEATSSIERDHIFVSGNVATVEQFRIVSNRSGTARATDHPNAFVDLRLELPLNSGSSSDWNDGIIQ